MKRRNLLKAIVGGSITSMTPMASLLTKSAMAFDGDRPIRTIFLFHPNGCVPDVFFPQPGTMNLPAMTAPLEDVKQHLLFLDGIGYAGRANTHEGGAAKCLTGYGGDQNNDGSKGISSIEVQMGKEDWSNRAQTQISIPSLQMGVGTKWGDNRNKRISFDGQQDLHAVDDPRKLYTQIFGGADQGGSGDSGPDAKLEILSAVQDDLSRMRNTLGSVERERLELHADSLSILEAKINQASGGGMTGGGMMASCSTGPNVSPVGDGNQDSLWRTSILETVSDVQQDIAVQALSCNLTRSIAFSYGVSVSPIVVPGTSTGDHDLSHQDAAAHTTSKIWWMAEINKFIKKLAATPDGNGTLLDNTVLVTVSDLGHGNYHNHFRIPMFLAGGKNAGLVTGRSLNLGPYGTQKPLGDQNANDKSINHSDVLTTIAERAGYSSIDLPTTEGRIDNAWDGGDSP